MQPVLALGDLLDDDLGGVRNLLAGALQHLLADELGQVDLARPVRALVGRVEHRPLGQELGEALDELLEPGPGPCADREDLVDRLELGGVGEHLGGLGAASGGRSC